jgi:hypothetical protein
MTINFTIIYQIVLTIIQVLNALNAVQFQPAIAQKVTPILAIALTIAQAVQGVIAHFYTPTGVSITPNTTVQTPEAVGPQAAR